MGGNIESKPSASPSHHSSLHFPRKTNCLTDASISELKHKTGRVIFKYERSYGSWRGSWGTTLATWAACRFNCGELALFGGGDPRTSLTQGQRLRWPQGTTDRLSMWLNNNNNTYGEHLFNVYHMPSNMLSTSPELSHVSSLSPYEVGGPFTNKAARLTGWNRLFKESFWGFHTPWGKSGEHSGNAQVPKEGRRLRSNDKMYTIPGLTFNSCVTLAMPLTLSLAQFPSL